MRRPPCREQQKTLQKGRGACVKAQRQERPWGIPEIERRPKRLQPREQEEQGPVRGERGECRESLGSHCPDCHDHWALGS